MKDTEKIKEKIDIVDFIGDYIDLKKAGKNFKAICPFHEETDASFIVSPERETWHCFGCGEGGDIIKFVMMYENFEFPEALRFLADKAGVKIDTWSKKEQKEVDTLYKINKEAENFFHKKLAENKEALKYLKSRGLESETIKEFKLGYSPGGDDLIVHLTDKKFRMADIKKAGLVYKRKSGMYRDRFSGRIMFPLKNKMSKTVGFSGRILKQSDNDSPKYVNTPKTPVYNKSKLLYGLSKSKPNIIETKKVFLVEGQMDVLMSWQSGIKNVVAVSGTSLTTQHLVNLQRLADTVLVSFDNDSGGLRALERAIDLFGKFDFHVKAVNLGDHEDPADACQSDPGFLKNAIKESKPAMTRLFEANFDKDLGTVDKKKKVRKMLGKIKSFKSSIDQDTWLKELAKYSDVSETSLRVEFEEIDEPKERSKPLKKDNIDEMTQEKRVDLISHRILVLAFTNDDFLPIVKDSQELFPDKYKEIIKDPEGDKAGFLDMEATYETGDMEKEQIEKEFKDLIRHLKIEYLKKRQSALKNKMHKLDDETQEKNEILERFQKVSKKIDELRRQNVYKI